MNQAMTIASIAPEQTKTTATVSRQNALNGTIVGESPLVPMPWPVSTPQPTVATRAMPVASHVRCQTGRTTGSRRVASSDWPIRSAQTLPTPTAARTAMTMCAGRITAATRADERGERPAGRLGRPSTARA